MEPIFIVIPVEKMLGMFQFSPVCCIRGLGRLSLLKPQGFGDTIVYPLVALFMVRASMPLL